MNGVPILFEEAVFIENDDTRTPHTVTGGILIRDGHDLRLKIGTTDYSISEEWEVVVSDSGSDVLATAIVDSVEECSKQQRIELIVSKNVQNSNA